MSNDQPYKPVRALNRGLVILQELNRLGSGRPAELAKAAGIDRTTTYRLLATLAEAGLVRESSDRGDYMLTDRVRTLSEGFTQRDRMTQVVTPSLGALFQKVLWPTDFATFERGAMIIRETTHRFSPYSVHRAMIGQPRPLLNSALGRAALAGSTPVGRNTMIEIARGLIGDGDVSFRRFDEQIDHLLSDFAKRGFAFSVGGSDGRISAIGIPIATATGIAAAVNLVFFSSAMSVDQAAQRFLEPLRDCASIIERDLAADRAEGLSLSPAQSQSSIESAGSTSP